METVGLSGPTSSPSFFAFASYASSAVSAWLVLSSAAALRR